MTDRKDFPNGYQFFFTDDLINSCSNADLIVALLHWYIVHDGFKCDNSVNLPGGWNSNQELYVFNYSKEKDSSQQKLTIKVLKIADDCLMVHFCGNDDSTQSVELTISKFVSGERGGADDLFVELESLKVDFDLLLSITKVGSKTNAGVNTENNYNQSRVEASLRDFQDPIASLRAPPIGGPSRYPFDYGRSDLDPFGSHGGGGMIFPPMAPRRPQDMFPPGRGSIPPGARFDPFGPPGLGPSMFNPDPDHLRMPGANPRGFGNDFGL